MICRLFFFFMASCVCFTATAQTKVQHGVVRMITHSGTDPIVPVQNVQFIVNQVSCKPSDKNGRFSLSVRLNREHSYTISDVRLPKGSNLVLASPARKKKLYLSNNDLVVTLVSPEEKHTVKMAAYRKLKRAYDKQADSIRMVRSQLQEKLSKAKEGSKEYERLQHESDSIQALVNEYFDEKHRAEILKEIERMSEELAVTDYQTLDSIEARIYDLKMQGDWPTISKVLHELMGGDAAAWMQRKSDWKNKTEEELQQGIRMIKAAIESYEEQGEEEKAEEYRQLLREVEAIDEEKETSTTEE